MSNNAHQRLTANINTLLKFTRRKQSALAVHMGISQPHVSNLLNGKRLWQIEDLDLVADFFNVNVADLFRDSGGVLERRSGIERRIRGERRVWKPHAVVIDEEEDPVESLTYDRPPGTTLERVHDYYAGTSLRLSLR